MDRRPPDTQEWCQAADVNLIVSQRQENGRSWLVPRRLLLACSAAAVIGILIALYVVTV